jgi:hypothetical protein
MEDGSSITTTHLFPVCVFDDRPGENLVYVSLVPSRPLGGRVCDLVIERLSVIGAAIKHEENPLPSLA